MSATGGLAKQATNFYKRLASLLADKWMQPYSTTLYWLRCSLSFSLLRSAIQCIRGARSSRGHAVKLSPVDLVTAEALRPDPFHHPVHARSEDCFLLFSLALIINIFLPILLFPLSLPKITKRYLYVTRSDGARDSAFRFRHPFPCPFQYSVSTFSIPPITAWSIILVARCAGDAST